MAAMKKSAGSAYFKKTIERSRFQRPIRIEYFEILFTDWSRALTPSVFIIDKGVNVAKRKAS